MHILKITAGCNIIYYWCCYVEILQSLLHAKKLLEKIFKKVDIENMSTLLLAPLEVKITYILQIV